MDWDNIVKGYEVDDQYVILTDEDFEKASPENSNRLEIITFIKENEINSIYFERPYYIEPTKSGTKPYALLRKALLEEKKSGVCTFVLRNKAHLGIIKVHEKVLVLIKQKSKGKKPSKTKMKVVHKSSDDLMKQLKSSLKKQNKKTS